MLQITEIYRSIQGESTYAGLPCVFIRTTGCNLRCTWCDTEYAFYGGRKMSVEDILTDVEALQTNLVEITGGEPLLQKDVPELAEQLLEKKYTVLVETSGERDISLLPEHVIKIMDLKCPGSGESQRNRWDNLRHLTMQDQVKFVIKDRTDYDWAFDVIHKHQLEDLVQILISPVFGSLDLQQLTGWVLDDHLQARVQIQMHKIIWKPETKGV